MIVPVLLAKTQIFNSLLLLKRFNNMSFNRLPLLSKSHQFKTINPKT